MQKMCQSISYSLLKESREGSGHQVNRPDRMHPTAKNQSAKTAWAAELHEVSVKAQCRLDIQVYKKVLPTKKRRKHVIDVLQPNDSNSLSNEAVRNIKAAVPYFVLVSLTHFFSSHLHKNPRMLVLLISVKHVNSKKQEKKKSLLSFEVQYMLSVIQSRFFW